MDTMKNIKKQWLNSLVFLDNCIVNSVIVVILLLYSSTIFENINMFIGNLYKFSIVKLVVLLLIIYVAPKDIVIALLLTISYVISLNYSVKENFVSDYLGCDSNESTNEYFQGFPFQHENEDKQIEDKNIEYDKDNNETNSSNCLNNYVPLNEELSDVCHPVSAFKNSFNTQGFNSPGGYGNINDGYPI